MATPFSSDTTHAPETPGVTLAATARESAVTLPAIGQGSWHMGENRAPRRDEVHALQYGLDLGMTLIDTAEMYADGGAEEIVGEALRGRRDEAFVVSKVYPWNAGRHDAVAACERSLKRLGTDHLDLYLLHWPGNVPLEETLEAFEHLQAQGKIRRYGVSNFDLDDMHALHAVPGGDACTVNQVLYHLGSRGIEHSLLPWQRQHGLPTMAYCPLAQGGQELDHPEVRAIADELGVSPAQVLLAWATRPAPAGQSDVIAIPKAVQPAHVEANAAAMQLTLDNASIARLNAAFPAPTEPVTLDIV
ncbi:aldo/keto reductase [Chromohalobacter sp. 296-RDG]|uniref:aldo/keto reductase n=1 Tax=Chromohalobacter sp. 296-RDG TaxID=2994062 RepID=UPI0024691FD7|nr:aldo/keto reductase [Chromohalobacter sp. 296-RDG]